MALRLSDRLTGDVDVVSEGMHLDVRRAVETVAPRHDLRPELDQRRCQAQDLTQRKTAGRIMAGASPWSLGGGGYLRRALAGP